MDGFLSSNEEDHVERSGRKFFDTYRWLHPNEANAFTNWCSTTGARATNYGCRLDYIISDLGLLPYLQSCHILTDIEGSDHCPVKAVFTCSLIAASKCPPLCTKYFKQFAGRQQKLAAFLVQKALIRTSANDCQSRENSCLCDVRNCLGNCSRDSCSESAFQSLDVNFPVSSGCSASAKSSYCVNRSLVVETCLKRTLTEPTAPKAKKVKNSGFCSSSKQSSLLNFFSQPNLQKQTCLPTAPAVCKSTVSSTCTSKSNLVLSTENEDNATPGTDIQTNCEENVKLPPETSSAWKNLLKGPPQAPLCKGHCEPCVLRTVKKNGPNKGKQFWTCNRPEGHKNNPDARCDYFVWVSKS